MFDHVNPKNGERAPLVADDIYQIVSEVRRGFWFHRERRKR